MGHDDCLICKRYVDSRDRDVVIRNLVQRLVMPRFYPKLFRSFRELPLCANCISAIPYIENDICDYCSRAMDALTHQAHITQAPIKERLCRDCMDNENKQLQCNRSMISYNSWAKEIMALYKYRGEERFAHIFAVLLLACFYRYMYGMSFQLITYVPLHKNREEERGFNQVELIANIFGKYTKIPVIPLLIRCKETDKQSQQTSKQARLISMKDAFTAYFPHDFQIQRNMKPVMLIDDIYTTGSTLQSCASQIHEIPQLSFTQIVSLTVCR